MRTQAALLALVLAACGPSDSGPSDSVSDGDDNSGNEHVDTDSNVVESDPSDTNRTTGECPARYNQGAPNCEDDAPSGCAYPEGQCSCGTPVWCGGAAPPPMPVRWMCEPHRSPCSAAGSPCNEQGASCSTDACGWSGVRCVSGTWENFQMPPPP